MPIRIAYYTGWLRPNMEGNSREVFALARHFDARYILGISSHEGFRIMWKRRAFGLHPKAYALLKIALPFLERTQQISHIYGPLNSWHYLRNLRHNPVILTATSGRKPLPSHFYNKVSILVVDSESRYKEMLNLGFSREKLKIIYPGIDVEYFTPPQTLLPVAPFKVLFASAPPSAAELEGRGIWQILEAAKQLQEIEFILAWRSWGDSVHAVRNKIKDMKLPNVSLIEKLIPDMRAMYHRVHCVLAPFKENGGKSCPTSILEACACGLPVIIGSGVGIKDLLIEKGAGVYAGEEKRGLAEALQSVQKSWGMMRIRAREIAESHFSLNNFFKNYGMLYRQLVTSS